MVATMPTLESDSCSASAAFLPLAVLCVAMTVRKPLGCPQDCSAAFALLRSGVPALPVKGCRLASEPDRFGGIIDAAIAPPAVGPPRAVCNATLSAAYCTALRHSRLSIGGTVVA